VGVIEQVMTVTMNIVGIVWTAAIFVVVYRAVRFYASNYEDAMFDALALSWRHLGVTSNVVTAWFALWLLAHFFGG